MLILLTPGADFHQLSVTPASPTQAVDIEPNMRVVKLICFVCFNFNSTLFINIVVCGMRVLSTSIIHRTLFFYLPATAMRVSRVQLCAIFIISLAIGQWHTKKFTERTEHVNNETCLTLGCQQICRKMFNAAHFIWYHGQKNQGNDVKLRICITNEHISNSKTGFWDMF